MILFVTGTILLSWNTEIAKASEVFPFNGIINADSLVVYKGNNTDSGVLTELAYGTDVVVLEDASTKFYKISFDNGTIGYTWKAYIINVDNSVLTTDAPGSGVETYKDYCDKLISEGFDKSYCPYLYYLHVKHPNWVFNALPVASTLENASNREVEKVSLQTGNSNYWHYKANGEPYINEYSSSGNYYYVNAKVISSFMDPRNSLFEKTMFQFLNLEKNTDAINADALSKVSKTGNLSKYYNEFIK